MDRTSEGLVRPVDRTRSTERQGMRRSVGTSGRSRAGITSPRSSGIRRGQETRSAFKGIPERRPVSAEQYNRANPPLSIEAMRKRAEAKRQEDAATLAATRRKTEAQVKFADRETQQHADNFAGLQTMIQQGNDIQDLDELKELQSQYNNGNGRKTWAEAGWFGGAKKYQDRMDGLKNHIEAKQAVLKIQYGEHASKVMDLYASHEATRQGKKAEQEKQEELHRQQAERSARFIKNVNSAKDRKKFLGDPGNNFGFSLATEAIQAENELNALPKKGPKAYELTPSEQLIHKKVVDTKAKLADYFGTTTPKQKDGTYGPTNTQLVMDAVRHNQILQQPTASRA